MPQITFKANVYKVQLTEFERGWGQRPLDTLYFDNEEEAREYANNYNRENNNEPTVPDWYVLAEYRGQVG